MILLIDWFNIDSFLLYICLYLFFKVINAKKVKRNKYKILT